MHKYLKFLFIALVIILFLAGGFLLHKNITTKKEIQTSISEMPVGLPNSITAPQSKSLSSFEEIYKIVLQEDYSYNSLQKKSNVFDAVRKIKPDFNIDDIGVSSPSATAELENGNKITIFSGCPEHNCGGNENVIAFNENNGEAYLLVEADLAPEGYDLYGNPPEDIKNILIYTFKKP